MNKKTEELATQAGLKLEDLPDDVFVPLEKFAELLIKETVKVCGENMGFSQYEHLRNRITQTFGVK